MRSAQSLAARDEREHQWVTAPILSEGHGPEHAQRRRACRRGGNAEWSSAQDAGMENTCRGFGRAYEIGAHCCCDDRLNSSWLPWSLWWMTSFWADVGQQPSPSHPAP